MPTPLRLLTRGSWPEAQRFAEILRRETVGGVLLLVAAGASLIWANSPWSSAYSAMSEFVIGPESLHLNLSVSAWAADGLLAIFFFVVGLELKREFVAGDLRDPRRAALPIAAAVGGMVVPAAIYVAINAGGRASPTTSTGWAVPIATDIAFALAVLAVLSTHLPSALRTFLLTLAVVDDLLAITVIAVFFTDHLRSGPLALAADPDRTVRARCAARCPAVVAAGSAGRRRLGAGACQRGARHRRRRAARLHGAGARTSWSSRRRAVRARHAAGVGGVRRAGVRVLRRRGDGRGLVRPRRRRCCIPSPIGVIAGSGRRQTPRRVRHRVSVGQVHPRQPRRRPRLAGCLGRLTAGRHRVHSVVIDRRTGLRLRHRDGLRRQDRCAGRVRYRRLCWPRSFC